MSITDIIGIGSLIITSTLFLAGEIKSGFRKLRRDLNLKDEDEG